MHKNFIPQLPERGFVRLQTILQLIPVGKSSWWDGVKKGIYPQPVKIGARVTAWRVEDINSLIDRISTEALYLPSKDQ